MPFEFNVKRIIVPTDFSDAAYNAIEHAVLIAKNYNAKITLVHVLETGAYAGIFSPSKASEYEEKEHAQTKIQNDARELEEKTGLDVNQLVVSGKIYEEIVNAAEQLEADITIMGTHGVSGWEEFFLGSNAFKVVTQSPCPILTIQQSSKATGYKNIVLPIDSTSETRQKVPYAAKLAQMFNSTIHVGLLITDDEPEVRYDFEKKLKQITDFLKRENVSYTSNILFGDNLATMTMNYAETKSANLIVTMTEQEYNLTGFLMGPFAQQIVNHSKIPVLSISPEDLVVVDGSFHALG